MIKAIIIDDEQLSRDLIATYLKVHEDITVVATCGNGFEGLKAIQEHQPDLLFLDIQMPKITGFEMLELIESPPVVIFSTAYDQYAIKAFELSAIDYLLKPYAQDRFNEAVTKAKDKIQNSTTDQENLELLVNQRQELDGELERLVVKSGSKINIIAVRDVEYIEAQDDYVAIYSNGQKYMKQLTMKYLETHLPIRDFIRVHRSYIVAIKQINRLELYGKDSHVALLQNGNKLPVSRSGYTRLKKVLNF